MRERRAAALLVALFGLAACDASRSRPLPTSVTTPVELFAEVVSPGGANSSTVLAGATVSIVVRAGESGGRLHGAGYVARRSGSRAEVLDSASVAVPLTQDTVVRFSLTVPPTMPNNAQINIFGIAMGPGDHSFVSPPAAVVVLQCPPNATWC